jgi:ribonuclease P protein component
MERRLRLRRSEDFERIRRQGRKYNHPLMMISVLPNGLMYNRYGIVTGKQLGKAVARNRVRRLIRAALQVAHPDLAAGYDVVIVARPALVGQPFEVVQRIMMELTARAGLILAESDRL